MATKYISIGSLINAYGYDDVVYPNGLSSDGAIRTSNAPVSANDVLRLADIGGTGVAPADAQYIVLTADGDLSQERILAVANGLKKTDGGAGANITLEIDAASTPTLAGLVISPTTSGNVLSANGSAFVSVTPDVAGLVAKSGNQTGIAGNKTWTGNHIFQTAVDSTTGFQVLDADGGTPILNINTQDELVGIGTNSATSQLEIKSLSSNSYPFRVRNSLGVRIAEIYESSIAGGRFFLSNSAGVQLFVFSGDGTSYMTAGSLGIGTDNPKTLLHTVLTDTTGSSVSNVFTIEHRSTISPTSGFGVGLLFTLESTTTDNRGAARITSEWVVATDASRTARSKWTVYDTAEREAIRIEASGTAAMIGVFGVGAVVRAAALTQTYSTADRTHAARSASTLTDSIGGTTGTTLAAIPDPTDTPITADALRDDLVLNVIPKIRDALSSLALQHNNGKTDSDDTAQFINSIADDLQLYGWES